MKLFRCTACGKIGLWGPEWGHFTSRKIDEECPKLAIFVCSKACKNLASTNLENRVWQMPRLSSRGYVSKVTPQKGYEGQPSQRELQGLVVVEVRPKEANL